MDIGERFPKSVSMKSMDSAKVAKGEGPSIFKMPLSNAFWKVHKGKYFKWLIVKILNDFNQTIPAILLNK